MLTIEEAKAAYDKAIDAHGTAIFERAKALRALRDTEISYYQALTDMREAEKAYILACEQG